MSPSRRSVLAGLSVLGGVYVVFFSNSDGQPQLILGGDGEDGSEGEKTLTPETTVTPDPNPPDAGFGADGYGQPGFGS